MASRWTAVEEVRVIQELDDDLRETWYRLGMANPVGPNRGRPAVHPRQLRRLLSIEELKERIGRGNWSLGTGMGSRSRA